MDGIERLKTIAAFEAMREAARNEGGGAGIGMGLGAGMGLGQTMAQSMGNQFGTANQPVQSETTSSKDDPMEKLTKLKKMFDAQLINEEEYTAKKKDILDNF